jgi:predicted Zn-dependent protease
MLVAKRQDYTVGYYALGEALAQKGQRQEAVKVFREYLNREQDAPDTHQRIEQARTRLKELEG